MLAILTGTFGATTPPHRITELPGWEAPLTTEHWSGFVEVDKASGTHLFYVLAMSAHSPSTDPIVWWMNGGPGASSLAGMFGENGPLLLAGDSKTLFPNPYAWNHNANVLFVEFAPGIGNSFCDNSTVGDLPHCSAADRDAGACSPCLASDATVAAQNVILAETLFAGDAPLFPKMKGRALYLAGESYAGVYIPTLAQAIITTGTGSNAGGLNLHGIWVTDPCTDNVAQFGYLDLGIDFLFQMGILSQPLYATLNSTACSPARTRVGDRVRSIASPACRAAWRSYDLASAGIGDAVHPAGIRNLPMYIDPLSALGPSGGADLPGYLGRADVRAALGATASKSKVYQLEIGNNGYPQYTLNYAACNPDPTLAAGTPSMLDVHRFLATAPQTHPDTASNFERIIISSGDIDPVVSLHGTEKAVAAIGYSIRPGYERRPWFYHAKATPVATLRVKPRGWGASLGAVEGASQVGGFTKSYAVANSAVQLDFVSVRNSGHMVPGYAPQRAQLILERMLLGNKALAPPLTAGWDTAEDAQWYGANSSGIFADWINAAMAIPSDRNEL